MIILPSRGRPRNVERFLDAYDATGATMPVWLRVDEDDPMMPEYSRIAARPPCTLAVGPRHGLAAAYNEAYHKLGDRDCWVFVADDVVPETPHWDVRLAAAAGTDCMAVPSGGHDPEGTPHFALGGVLVRDIGWLALPGLNRIYIDTAWADIARERGVLRRVPDVVLAHHHFSNGKALYDKTYRKERKTEDRAVYEIWRRIP